MRSKHMAWSVLHVEHPRVVQRKLGWSNGSCPPEKLKWETPTYQVVNMVKPIQTAWNSMLASVPVLCIHNESQWLDRNALCLRCSSSIFWTKYWQVLRFRQLFSALFVSINAMRPNVWRKMVHHSISFWLVTLAFPATVHLFKTCISRPILCGRCQRRCVICCDCRLSTWLKGLESLKFSFWIQDDQQELQRGRTHSNFKTPFLLRFSDSFSRDCWFLAFTLPITRSNCDVTSHKWIRLNSLDHGHLCLGLAMSKCTWNPLNI